MIVLGGGMVQSRGGARHAARVSRAGRKVPWRSALMAACLMPFGAAASHQAEQERPTEMEFNSRFLMGPAVDLSRFNRGNVALPGVYAVDVRVNGQRVGRADVRYVSVDGGLAEPCFSPRDLEQMGIDTSRVPEVSTPAVPVEGTATEPSCRTLGVIMPQAYAMLDLGELALDLTVPQAFVRTPSRGWVDPVRWNEGITAGLVDYSLNGYTSRPRHGGRQFNNLYLGLTSGLNLGSWRFRQRSTKSWSNNGSSSWSSLESYAQRGIGAWRSQVLLGDSYTSGELFDTFGLRGVRLFSDDRMLPDSMRSYAPIVRGLADTNAIVTVRQAGRVVHEENVPAGPFELTDLPASGYGGDLEVTVQEADGRQSSFNVPFSSVPMLLREGVHRYSLGMGKYRNAEFSYEPWVFEGTYQYGFKDGFTAYAGSQLASGYASLMLGSAINTRAGAFSVDITGADTRIAGESHKGFSTRLNYSNILSKTGTRFSMAGYRYSTSSFHGLRDAVYAREGRPDSSTPWNDYRVKQRFQANLSQPVGSRGNVFVMGSRQNYWNGGGGHDLQYQVGYSGSYRSLNYSIYGQRMRNGASASMSNQVMLTLSIPLGRRAADDGFRFNTLTSSVSRTSNGNSQIQASASGAGGRDMPVSFGVSASTADNDSGRTNTLGAFGSYRSPYGTYSANASTGSEANQLALGARGALVVHGGGVTAGPSLGRAAALVRAKGAAGARVINGQGAAIDANGYALVPSLTPYRVNNVMLDPSRLGMDVELGATSEEVVPTLDSVVLVEFRTEQGMPVLLRLRREDGEPVPLGSLVYQAEGERALGTVGQGGVALVRGMAEQGIAVVKWGDAPGEHCEASYQLPAGDTQERRGSAVAVQAMTRVLAECRNPVQAAVIQDRRGNS